MSDIQFENDILQGIQLLKAGKKLEAAKCFARAVEANSKSGKAWYWLAQAIDDPAKKAFCMGKAKELAPAVFEKKPAQPAIPTPPTPKPVQPVVQQSTVQAPPAVASARPAFTEEKPFKPISVPPPPIPQAGQPARPAIQPISVPQYAAPQPAVVSPVQSFRQQAPEPKPGFSFESMFMGLLVALVVIGLPFAFLGFTGRLDQILPVPQTGITDLTPNPVMLSSTASAGLAAASQTPTITFTPTITPTAGLDIQIQSVAAQMQTAKDKIDQMEYTDAIIDLDWIISQVPGYADAYYYRGLAYYRNTESLRMQTEYADYIQGAIENFDIAIQLGPVRSKYYEYRGYGLIRYASILELTVNRQRLYESALENLQLAYSMPDRSEDIPVYIANLYTEINQCDIGAEQEENLIASGTMSEELLQKIYSNLARSYLCLGEYQKALDQLDKLTGCNMCNDFNRTIALYSMGRKQEAFNVINQSITDYPSFSGDRYFLRAMIYLDWGQYENALDDMQTGEGNTWYRGEIYSYLAAMLSYYYGDSESGDAYLEFAAATIYPYTGKYINNLVQNQLAARGLDPFSDDSYEEVVTTTPFANGPGSTPSQMPTLTPTPTFTPKPPDA
jgi:predicted Zn-dependent protease